MTCAIDGCERRAQARGWCKMHWKRWRRHGDPQRVSVNGVDFNARRPCVMDGCDTPAHAHGLCPTHHSRYRRHGDPSIVLPITGRPLKGEVPTFDAAHKRLNRARGSAKSFPCVDCGGPASEWSYDHTDPEALFERVGAVMTPYSLDLDRYVPRCVSCHRRFDGAGGRQRNPDGTFAKTSG